MVLINKFFIFTAAFITPVIFCVRPALACITCVDEMIWMYFPFYKWWLAILCLWAAAVFIDKIRSGAGPFIFLRNAIIAIVSFFLSVIFFFLYPFVLLALFGKWAGNYYSVFKNHKNNNTPAEDKNGIYFYIMEF